MEKIKKFIGDTINFTYIKRLIAGEENKDLREFVAVMLSFTAVITFSYSIYVAKSDDARLYLLITLFSFIAALFGMEKFGLGKSKLPTPDKIDKKES